MARNGMIIAEELSLYDFEKHTGDNSTIYDCWSDDFTVVHYEIYENIDTEEQTLVITLNGNDLRTEKYYLLKKK